MKRIVARPSWLAKKHHGLWITAIAATALVACDSSGSDSTGSETTSTSSDGGGGGDGGGGNGGGGGVTTSTISAGGAGGGAACSSDTDCNGQTTCAPKTCHLGVCETDNEPTTTACSDDGGVVCDGNGACVACVSGDTRCDGDDVQACDPTGSWETAETCALGCSAGTCAQPYATWPMPNPPVPDGTILAFLDNLPNPRQLSVTDAGLTVSDAVTGLVWMNDEVMPHATWADAKAYCDSLVLADEDDWRLPTRLEGATVNGWAREGLKYSNVLATDWYSFWTVSTEPSTGKHWTIHEDWDGFASYAADNDTNQAVRCVRGATTPLTTRYTVRGSDDTVLDNGTKLRWTHSPTQPTTVNWSSAAAVCAALSTSSTAVGSWRIPTQPELMTLIDETVAQSSEGAVPAQNTISFPKATLPTHAVYWSATRWASWFQYVSGPETATAHYVDGNTGGTWEGPASDAHSVWCVHTDGCTPGDKRCTGEQPETCDATGSWMIDGSACSANFCVAGSCTGECSPGKNATCNGDVLDACDATGHATVETCALGCSAGTCALAYADRPMPNAPVPSGTTLPFLDALPNARQLSATDGGLTMTDTITGLVWMNDEVLPKAHWSTAKTYCNDLVLAGNDDWRLPTRLEGATINGWAKEGLGYTNPLATSWYSFWTVSTELSAGKHWAMHEDWDGFAGYAADDDTNQAVRCVRGARRPLATRYSVRASDDTVLDNGTRLRWTHTPSAATVATWADAKTACSGLSTTETVAGSWRIPTLPELLTLGDETVPEATEAAIPAMDPTTFPMASLPAHAHYWSATRWGSPAAHTSGDDTLSVHFMDGNTAGTWYSNPATDTLNVWCVHAE